MSQTISAPAGFFQNDLVTPPLLEDLASAVNGALAAEAAAQAAVGEAQAASDSAAASAASIAASVATATDAATAASTSEGNAATSATAAAASASAASTSATSASGSASTASSSATSASGSATTASSAATAASNSASSAATSATNAAASASVAPYLSLRNRLVNGNFQVNQRSYVSSTSLSSGVYAHDRWKAGSSGCTYSFSQGTPDTTITITAGSLQQVVEAGNVEGGSYTLSWSGTAHGRVNAGSYSVSPIVVTGLSAGTAITVEFNTGTLALVQLEPGSVSNPFERRPLGLTLALCQRYYQFGTAFQTAAGFSGGAYQTMMPLPTPMRTTPTMTNGSATTTNASGVSVAAQTASMLDLVVGSVTGSTYAVSIPWTASAEL